VSIGVSLSFSLTFPKEGEELIGSLWFKNQLAQPIVIEEDVKPDINPKTVRTELDDAALELFFDLITVSAQHSILSSLSYWHCANLLRFSERYQCVDLVPKLGSQLPLSVKEPGEPWCLFIFAASRNDWGLGRQALQKIDAEEIGRLRAITSATKGSRCTVVISAPGASNNDRHTGASTSTTKSDTLAAVFSMLPQHWRAVLSTLLLIKSYQQGAVVEDWSIIAEGFVKPVGKRKNR
jgi:hypothetical protein